jgi:hypothetical protein
VTGRIAPAREQTGSRQLDALQRLADTVARALNALPFSVGQATDLLTFTAAQTQTLNHRLGRAPVGFLVLYAQAAAPALYFAAAPDALTARVTSANAGAYRLWFF